MATISDLYIGGTKMPAPLFEGVSIAHEKIWSAATGRSASGKMLGTLVAIKATVSIKWPPLTPAEVKTIENEVTNQDKQFTTLKYTDINGETVEMEVYFGTPSGTWSSWEAGQQYINDYSVNAIER